MTTQTKALKLALDYIIYRTEDPRKVIETIEEALAGAECDRQPEEQPSCDKQESVAQPGQEPVYQIKDYDSDKGWQDVEFSEYETAPEARRILYTTAPQRTYPQAERAAWVGLTDDELRKLCEELWLYPRKLLQAIETKLKEKNL